MSKISLDEIEARWRAYWEEQGTYRWDPERGRDETFVVDTPPPTVSGSLHIGHVCSYTHTDVMVRYQRMLGKNIFYPMGWDDNGLPTERRVQNVFSVRCDPSLPYDPALKLEFGRQGDILPISRPNFIELCDLVVKEDEKRFMDLWKRLGLSIDWNENYATIDERCRYVSQLSFLDLVDKGEAEMRDAPTMWDVDFQSAVAQAEVEDREKEGAFYKIRFGIDGGGETVIATTRPELLPACIAVTAHPEDKRYKDIIGKTAVTPLFNAPVPVLADEAADPEKGTGILMICTFGDAADVEKWRELGVPAKEVIGRDGRIQPATWGEGAWTSLDPPTAQSHYDKIVGSSINQARRGVAEMLTEAGHTVGEPEKVRRPVKFFEKGDRPLEFVVSRQWFIKVMDKKKELIEQGRKIQWHPAMFLKRYEDWVEGLNQDWSVSRQRYFGVPIPVWYAVDADGNIDYERLILPRKEDLPVDPAAEAPDGFEESQRGQPGGFVGDPDVFDTWATSSLTPLIPTGWPDDPERSAKLYPTDLRPQAHDIIRTWAFTTITRSYLMDGSIPWKHAAISGFVLDPDRKKMSKSKGNTVVPTEPLDEYGPDAVRYWAASSRLGVDTAVDPNVYREGKRLVTKTPQCLSTGSRLRGHTRPPRTPARSGSDRTIEETRRRGDGTLGGVEPRSRTGSGRGLVLVRFHGQLSRTIQDPRVRRRLERDRHVAICARSCSSLVRTVLALRHGRALAHARCRRRLDPHCGVAHRGGTRRRRQCRPLRGRYRRSCSDPKSEVRSEGLDQVPRETHRGSRSKETSHRSAGACYRRCANDRQCRNHRPSSG